MATKKKASGKAPAKKKLKGGKKLDDTKLMYGFRA
jgi:hypothetical protein